MGKILMILEVSRKQDYIFASKRLRENSARSGEIAYVTSSEFFRAAAGDGYQEEENLVYTGGGHTVLQFDSPEAATQFARKVTSAAIRQYRGMELFVKQRPYDPALTPGENLTALTQALEAKKARRQASFRTLSLGVERLDPVDFKPVIQHAEPPRKAEAPLTPPEGRRFPAQFQELAAKDTFLAVVHVDGNAMGRRVQGLYKRSGAAGWDGCCQSLRRFSAGIQSDFERAFRETVDALIRNLPDQWGPALPIRPVILAGDDVCFVTAGRFGLECARVFLERLKALQNPEDGLPYAACAGVALVHLKYPFHRAYSLAEELCSSAKRFAAELDPAGGVCALDWHIEFGEMKGSLSQIREDYETEDGGRMELRPVIVSVPSGVGLEKTGGVRTYAFFRSLCLAMQSGPAAVTRRRLKGLRTAFRQGEVESRFFLRERKADALLEDAAVAAGAAGLDRAPFQTVDGVRRCLLFDATEMADHCEFFREVET